MIDDRYLKWIEHSWIALDRDFDSGNFSPRNESDVQAHLYHCMLQFRPERYKDDNGLVLTTEWEIPKDGRKVDLAVVRLKNLSGNDGRRGIEEPRLLIEAKETSQQDLPADEVMNRIQGDLGKLGDALRLCGGPYLRKPVVVFFFRGASRKGIPTGTARELDGLAEKLKEKTIFLFGPKGSSVST